MFKFHANNPEIDLYVVSEDIIGGHWNVEAFVTLKKKQEVEAAKKALEFEIASVGLLDEERDGYWYALFRASGSDNSRPSVRPTDTHHLTLLSSHTGRPREKKKNDPPALQLTTHLRYVNDNLFDKHNSTQNLYRYRQI